MLGLSLSVKSSDIIILVLANVVVAGSVIWLLTTKNQIARLAIVALIAALNIASSIEGSWVESFYEFTPIDWLYRLKFLQYLAIFIPGTVAGDAIVKWIKSSSDFTTLTNRPKFYGAIAIIFANFLVVMWALFTRHETTSIISTLIAGAAVWALLRTSRGDNEGLIKTLFCSGMFWLVLGLILEPFEGGIKKDPATLSYFFVTSGFAFHLLMIATILLQSCKWNMNFLIRCGQNPMIAYTVAGYLIVPLLTIANQFIAIPWIFGGGGIIGALGKGIITTLLMMIITSTFTKHKIFWRT